MASTTPGKSWTSPYSSQEILDHMRRSEAREWVKRYRAKAREIGARQAHIWWLGVIADIERKRGQEAALDLRVLMNQERKK